MHKCKERQRRSPLAIRKNRPAPKGAGLPFQELNRLLVETNA